MATKYFSALNSNRTIAGVRFEVVQSFAGSLLGVFATDNAALQASFSSEKIKATGVVEITEQEYNDYLQKKTHSLTELQHSNNALPKMAAIKGEGAALVVDGATKPVAGDVVSSTDDVLKLAGVDVAPVAVAEPAAVTPEPSPVMPEPSPAEPTAITTPAPKRKQQRTEQPPTPAN